MYDLYGLVTVAELISLAGDFLSKKSLRRMIPLAAVLGAWAYSGRVDEKDWSTARKFYSVTGAGVLSGAVVGLAAKYLPKVFEKLNIGIATGNDYKCLPRRKKSREGFHIRQLWDRVYRYESEILHSDFERDRERYKLEQNRPHLERLTSPLRDGEKMPLRMAKILREAGKCWNGFRDSLKYALDKELPPKELKARCGFGVGKFLDWYGESFFSDENILAHHFNNSTALRKVKTLVNWKLTMTERSLLMRSAIFRNRIGKTTQAEVGKLLDSLNKKYDTELFTSPDVMWPGRNITEQEIVDILGLDALKDLDLGRHEELYGMYRSLPTAERKIHRAYAANFIVATRLRLLFDIEYAASKLRQRPKKDCKSVNVSFYSVALCDEAKATMREYIGLVRRNDPSLFEDPSAFRTGALLYNVTRHNPKSNVEELLKSLSQAHDKSLQKQYSSLLTKVRKHHTVTLLDLREHRREIKALWNYSSPLLEAIQ